MNRLQRLREAGVSIWLDALSRELLETDEFARLVGDCAATGATSNPTIFAKAIAASDRYDQHLRARCVPQVSRTRRNCFDVPPDVTTRVFTRPPVATVATAAV